MSTRGGRGGKGGRHGVRCVQEREETRPSRVGDTKLMGGLTLVAVERDGSIRWEPADGVDSIASREVDAAADRDEARWRRDREAIARNVRAREANECARKEQQRKAEVRTMQPSGCVPGVTAVSRLLCSHQLFGVENVCHTSRPKGPHVPVPPLLAQTREEEAAARKAGMNKSAPKQYQVA